MAQGDVRRPTVTLGEAIASALPRLQAEAESMMTDSCVITRPGTKTFDDTTGNYTPGTDATVYTGKCRIRTRSLGFLRDRQTETGEELATIWPYIVAIPAGAGDIQVLDEVTVTSADPILDGITLRVRIASAGTSTTARRLDCEQLAHG